jgi:hypothetical protein
MSDKEPTETEKRGFLGPPATVALKQKFVAAFADQLGNISETCKIARCCRASYFRWIKNDPLFAELTGDILEAQIDYVESKLAEKIRSGDNACIIFFLKCKAKSRGFIERAEYAMSGSIANTPATIHGWEVIPEPVEVEKDPDALA